MKFQKNDYQNEGRFKRCDSVDAIYIKKRGIKIQIYRINFERE